jgi:hypothetical protein
MFLLHPAFCHSFQVYGWSDRVCFIQKFCAPQVLFKENNYKREKSQNDMKNVVFGGFQPATLY